MADYKMVMLYKRGKVSSAGVAELRKSGFACVAVEDFADVQFKMAGGIGFEDELGDLQVMVLKAALECYNFPGKIGELVTGALKAKIKAAQK